MVVTLAAGMRPTAAELNDIAAIGSIVGNVTATSDSSTFNSATKVLLGLTATFTAPASATYAAYATFTHTCASASNQDAFGLVWKLGTVAATDALFASSGPRTHPDATGNNVSSTLGVFTTSSAGSHQVALIGFKPTGNTGVSKLKGDPGYAINRLIVIRVG